MTLSKSNIILLAHAMLGGAIGFFGSVIFLALYYGIQYEAYVPDEIRFKTAFWDTAIIMALIFVVMFHKDLIRLLNDAFAKNDECDDDD
jgi:hypothetical protein